MRGWRGPTPERPFPSLGWQVLDWTYAYLPSPADELQPLVYTQEQARRIVKWFEIHPISGDFVWLRLILEEAKGYGKSPFAGSLDIVDFRGPVCFDGWDANGEPVGVPWGTGNRPPPWVQIAAVSEDQTDNTYGAMYSMLASRGGKVADALDVDLGRTRLLVKDMPSAVLEPVTASAGSREGQRLTKATLDETWLWTPRNGGIKLARTLRRNVAKMGGRTVETTNSPIVGEKSVAEQSHALMPDSGVLHYARRPAITPSPDWTDERLLEALRYVYDDIPWSDPLRLLRECRDPATPWDDALRFWFNIRTAGSGRAIDPRVWDALARPGGLPPKGTRIGAGFDGSISRDATVLEGCTAEGYSFNLGVWQPPQGAVDWTVPRLEVAEKIEWMFDYFDVGLFNCDPPKWETEIETWQRRWTPEVVVPLDTNQARKFARPVDRWLTAIREGTHTHDANALVDEHVKAAHLQKVRLGDADDDGRTMYVLVKGDDKGRIDGAVADVLAHEAAMTMPAAAPSKEILVRWA